MVVPGFIQSFIMTRRDPDDAFDVQTSIRRFQPYVHSRPILLSVPPSRRNLLLGKKTTNQLELGWRTSIALSSQGMNSAVTTN
ncbi:unnamed protein product [Macrosiphum euphorbiae]|uniref:Uncharacterized protein n=1 Tax=Macrosiphum euphorbiae TaxID=13131 RepID=A0AAV0WGM5_9HEMI|nr:unnamed protein product [Macrosiphum euphorbiae]